MRIKKKLMYFMAIVLSASFLVPDTFAAGSSDIFEPDGQLKIHANFPPEYSLVRDHLKTQKREFDDYMVGGAKPVNAIEAFRGDIKHGNVRAHLIAATVAAGYAVKHTSESPYDCSSGVLLKSSVSFFKALKCIKPFSVSFFEIFFDRKRVGLLSRLTWITQETHDEIVRLAGSGDGDPYTRLFGPGYTMQDFYTTENLEASRKCESLRSPEFFCNLKEPDFPKDRDDLRRMNEAGRVFLTEYYESLHKGTVAN